MLLFLGKQDCSVDLEGEVKVEGEGDKNNLRLCLSNLQAAHFVKEANGTIVLVNLSHCSFLPPSFFDWALANGSPLATLIAPEFKREKAANVDGLSYAHYVIMVTQHNDAGASHVLLILPSLPVFCSPSLFSFPSSLFYRFTMRS